eukprot:2872716-Lingulodinium_polyedra.AAC.1
MSWARHGRTVGMEWAPGAVHIWTSRCARELFVRTPSVRAAPAGCQRQRWPGRLARPADVHDI